MPIPAEVPADATGALFEVAAAMAMAEPVGVVPADPAEPPAIKAATPKAKTSVKSLFGWWRTEYLSPFVVENHVQCVLEIK